MFIANKNSIYCWSSELIYKKLTINGNTVLVIKSNIK